MNAKARIQKDIPVCVRLIGASVLGAALIGLSGNGFAGAPECKAAETRPGVLKANQKRATQAPVRPAIATQKLMRNPWERIPLKVEVATFRSGVSSEELPYFYW
ncbi:MAG: hypothetical protein HY017_11830 [Betaproteobacteria bacterium]|nr:hypothetical protein [Betaproteobacteria bacterium]